MLIKVPHLNAELLIILPFIMQGRFRLRYTCTQTKFCVFKCYVKLRGIYFCYAKITNRIYYYYFAENTPYNQILKFISSYSI